MTVSKDPSNPEELVKYIASCVVEIADKIEIESVEEENKIIKIKIIVGS